MSRGSLRKEKGFQRSGRTACGDFRQGVKEGPAVWRFQEDEVGREVMAVRLGGQPR